MEQAVWAPYGNERSRPSSSDRIDFDKRHLPTRLFNQDYSSFEFEVDGRGPIGELEAPGEPPPADRCPGRADRRAAAPGTSPGFACAATGGAGLRRCSSSLIVALRAWRRRCGPTTSPTPGPNKNHTPKRSTVDGEKREVVAPDGKPIGPRVRTGASSSSAPTPHRPRRDGAADVRRPHLALHRRLAAR